MTTRNLSSLVFLCLLTVSCTAASWAAAPTSGNGPLRGNGKVSRNVLTYDELFAKRPPAAPVDDNAGFGVPANAAAPSESFEGTLRVLNPQSGGGFKVLRDDDKYDNGTDTEWRHLANFDFQFVQDGSRLIPVRQGLVITGSPAWNYIVGPGRVWQERGDKGYMRASFPFALVERNQNCVHNGEMTFLFSNHKKPNVSNVRYQVTQETCLYLKFEMWGLLAATYTPERIANDKQLEDAAAAELSNRLPTKPFSALAVDYPKSGVNLADFLKGRRSPSDVTTYGLFINGVNYVSGCPTRYGMYAFCDNMRVPSYSLAKSSFAGVAMMWLGQKYGSSAYAQLIRSYVPEYVDGGDWSKVTFANASDMATGNYISAKREADEGSREELAFLTAEPYTEKIADAFRPFPRNADPGTTWVYQTSATFILTQAMNGYLQQHEGRRRQDNERDIFDEIRDAVYKPIHFSQGGLSMLRTDNSTNGKPFGGYGLFLIQDDVAKLGRLLNNSGGVIEGKQLLHPIRLTESLFRTANPAMTGLPIPDEEGSTPSKTFRYHNYFWGKYVTTAEFPQYPCNFWISFMSGYGGNSVVLLPNGATFYIFSDGNEFVWYSAVNEINKIMPLCH